ncbi:MAG: hypothetical protein HY094_08665 [Candidatus Melainabacteria bacterium]|nr:hypothetical protein [Candidatus Melainabacteria bacterium]
MKRVELKKLTNKELLKRLSSVNWCDRDLLREYDERNHDGRIERGEPIPLDKLEDYIRKKYAERRKKKAS